MNPTKSDAAMLSHKLAFYKRKREMVADELRDMARLGVIVPDRAYRFAMRLNALELDALSIEHCANLALKRSKCPI
jgi:hypothetical protein